jgi:epoxide hydrolase-like predicted phosphatase
MTDNTLRAMMFDYGGVLMRTVDPRPRRELERAFDLEPGEVYDLIFRNPRWDDVQHGRIDSDAFWTQVGEELDLDEQELTAFRRGFWGGDRLDEELVALIRHLRGEGYQTALLSNAPADMEAYIEELGIADAFDVMVISGDEGLAKPAPEIYDRALERLGVTPEEAVFIDDMRVNVAAARRLGLQTTRFRGLAPLRVWLADLGLSLPERELDPVEDVRAVIFDWGGVMEELPNEADVAAWERRLALASGVLPEVLWGEAWSRLKVGAISDEDYVRHVADHLSLPDAEAALDFLQAFYTSDRLNPSVMQAAKALRARYRVALLSNAFPAQVETILDQYGVDVNTEFDVYVNSALVGLSKPDPEIYYLTLERLDVEPEQAVFLDDMLRNVDSAREIGIHALQFVDPETSLADLAALLGHAVTAEQQD